MVLKMKLDKEPKRASELVYPYLDVSSDNNRFRPPARITMESHLVMLKSPIFNWKNTKFWVTRSFWSWFQCCLTWSCPFLILRCSVPICKMRSLSFSWLQGAPSDSDVVCLTHCYSLGGAGLSGLAQNHLVAWCVALEACCLSKGCCVWIASGFNQRGSKYRFMKMWLWQRKRVISESSIPGNGWDCLLESEAAAACLPQWLEFL